MLSVPTLTGKPLPLYEDEQPDIGEKIYAIGNPSGLSGTISEGIVSGIRTLEQKKLIQITAPISPGSSGGPVINNFSQVIGVAVGTLTSGQNLNFAIPASYVKKLLNNESSNLISLNIPKTTTTKATTNEKDIREGLLVRNLKYETGLWSSSGIRENHKLLQSFSFKNETPYTIWGIKVLYIVYDKSGVPIDYQEEYYCTSTWEGKPEDGIKPYLAKTIELGWRSESYRALRLENNYEKLEIRILNSTNKCN